MDINSEYIAPWAISKERFPLHLIWSNDSAFDKIKIHLHPDLKIRELLNVKNYSIVGNTIEFGPNDLFGPNYFSLILFGDKTYNDLMKELPIEISFLNNSVTYFKKELTAHIMRPKISIENAPDKIIIDDNTKLKNLLNFKILHKGLGKVKVELVATTKGEIISQSDSLYFQVIQEVAEDLSEITESTSEITSESTYDDLSDDLFLEKGLSVEPNVIQNYTTRVLDMIDSGKYPSTMRKKMFEHLSEISKDEKGREKLIQIIYTKLHRVILSYLLYYFDKNPHEDIEIPGGKFHLNLDIGVKTFILKIAYIDSQKNSYDPIEHSVQIVDNRTNKIQFQLPINIHWNSELAHIDWNHKTMKLSTT